MSSSPSVTIRLLRLAQPQLGLLAIATCSLLISSGLSLAYPQAVRWMVDLVVEGNDRALLNQVAVLLVLMFLVQSVFTMLRAAVYGRRRTCRTGFTHTVVCCDSPSRYGLF